jgi:hypothetical protein
MKNDPDTPSDRVATRCVVQICGFDPRGASFYHGMFSREAAKHSEKRGINLDVGRRRRLGNRWHEWTAKTGHAGHAESVTFLFLGWDDIIRRHWTKSRPAMFRKACATYFTFLKTGGLFRCFRLTWYPMFALLYPALGFVALYLILMLALGAAFAGLAVFSGLTDMNPLLAGTLGALAGAGAAHLISPRLKGAWLLRIYCFCHLLAERPMPELEERLDAQVADLLEHLEKERPDELLVAAHSVGSIIAVPFLDRLLRSGKWQGRVSLLTLGECIPLTSFLQPQADSFNAILKRVALDPRLDWIDFSMPSDGACFALLDPVRATFRETIDYPQADLPKFLSPRFMEGYSKERFDELKRNRYLYHFAYLMSPDLPAAFDFPAIALGDKRLAERYRDRKNQARNRDS